MNELIFIEINSMSTSMNSLIVICMPEINGEDKNQQKQMQNNQTTHIMEQASQSGEMILNQRQYAINRWKSDISRIQTALKKKYNPQQLSETIKTAFQLYLSGYIPQHEIQLIQSQLQVRYPYVPKQQIISKVYHYYQDQLKFSKDTDFIIKYFQQQVIAKDPTHAIDCLHQYLLYQGHMPVQSDQVKLPLTYVPFPIVKNKKIEKEAVDDFYDEAYEDDEDAEFFEGKVVHRGIQLLKQNMQNFLGQKKVVHVYTKKGYGIQVYRQYLQKRKLDQKEWQFYETELVQKNNYSFYLSSAIHATLHIIIDFVRNLKNHKYRKYPYSHIIKQDEFNLIINSIYQLQYPLNKYMNDCLRVVHDLKIDQKLSYKNVQELYGHISQIRKHNQQLLKKRTEMCLNENYTIPQQVLQLNQFDDEF